MNCHILKFFTIKWNSLLLVGHSVSFFFLRFTQFSAYSQLIFFCSIFISLVKIRYFFFQCFFFLDIFLALNKMILVKTALSILFAKLSCLKRSYNFNHVQEFFFWLVFSFSFLRRKGKRFCSTNCDYFDTFFGSVFLFKHLFF